MKRYQTSVFIFRRDLRVFDNTGLNAAFAQSAKVLPIFIFDPRQIEKHAYQSQPALQFMFHALQDLQVQLNDCGGRLFLYHGQPETIISQIHRQLNIQAVFVNRDYTPFSRKRDADLTLCCTHLGINFHSQNDLLLTEPEQVFNQQHQPYKVFTPFFRQASLQAIAFPQTLSSASLFVNHIASYVEPPILPNQHQVNSMLPVAGRKSALALLQRLLTLKDYVQQRDFPALAATSGLSAYLKFGCCSIREAYHAVQQQLGADHALIRQFYWRDFFTHIAYHYPHVFGHAFNLRYQQLPWRNDKVKFLAWTQGVTGFPIVDAAMRELNTSGCMHNRLRMITASFLCKDLHIDWRWGERYFAQHLVDYDPCVNNGNWQWAASTGCDAQPYFRVFNPWLQQLKFDPDCIYIKHWLPELANHSVKQIHHWHAQTYSNDYPLPIVDHQQQSAWIIKAFKQI